MTSLRVTVPLGDRSYDVQIHVPATGGGTHLAMGSHGEWSPVAPTKEGGAVTVANAPSGTIYTATIKVLLARYVWGERLREQVIEGIEEVPVVQEASLEAEHKSEAAR